MLPARRAALLTHQPCFEWLAFAPSPSTTARGWRPWSALDSSCPCRYGCTTATTPGRVERSDPNSPAYRPDEPPKRWGGALVALKPPPRRKRRTSPREARG